MSTVAESRPAALAELRHLCTSGAARAVRERRRSRHTWISASRHLASGSVVWRDRQATARSAISNCSANSAGRPVRSQGAKAVMSWLIETRIS